MKSADTMTDILYRKRKTYIFKKGFKTQTITQGLVFVSPLHVLQTNTEHERQPNVI